MGKLLRTLVPFLIGIVLAVGGIFAAYQAKLIPLGDAAAADRTPVKPAALPYSTRERVVNLADQGALRYLKVQVVLEFADPEHAEGELRGEALEHRHEEFTTEMRHHAAAIDDFIISTLTRKTSKELLTPEGKEHLREELAKGIQELLPEMQLQHVYFTEFIIQ
uniref:Flagellar protein FliL n=1 Tax=Thermorudis sp. TaxID=1969470 RepID=A0A7C2WI29_9BACT